MATLWYRKPLVGWTQISGLSVSMSGRGVTKKDVNFYDYDGTLVAGYTIAEARALTALPSAPDHSGDTIPKTFQSWNYTLSQVNATTTPLDVGGIYVTTDGKTWFHIRVTAVSGGSIPFYFSKSSASDTLEINYGDGQSDSDGTNSTVTFTPSTALSAGDHYVSAWISNGSGTITLGQGTANTTCVGGSTPAHRNTLIEVFCGDDVSALAQSAFHDCHSLFLITLSSGITSCGTGAFQLCYSLLYLLLPSGITSIPEAMCNYCYSLLLVSAPYSITSIGYGALRYCTALDSFVVPNGVTSIGTAAFEYDYSLASLSLSNSITAIPSAMCDSCYALSSVTIPSSVTTIDSYAFQYCYSLTEITYPAGIGSIDASAFNNNYSIIKHDFSTCIAVPTLVSASAFTGINTICLMDIPTSLYGAWSAASNWSTYVNYMEAI